MTAKSRKINWRYALGELAIVTIGILIAFGINRFADQKRNAAKLEQYYHNLMSDLQKDIQQLQTIDARIEQANKNLFIILQHTDRELPGKDTIPILYFKNLKNRYTFYPSDATYQSLKYSGDFQLINNLELKNQIVNHYNQYGLIAEVNEQLMNSHHSFLTPYLNKKLNYSLFRPGAKHPTDFLNDREFINLLYTDYGLYLGIQQAVRDASTRANNLLVQLSETTGKKLPDEALAQE